jgi:glycosyltransferase involved in cell wall biosynthesis
VEAIAAEVQPDVVMERYYNFGGEGVGTATRRGIPSLLEVNSPVVDHPRSAKQALDAALLLRPMRRYRESLCRQAAALVSPIPEIVPAFARAKTETVTWGANVDAFSPDRRREEGRRALGIPEGTVVVVFTGSFRPWHGVHVLEAAARQLHDRADLFFLLVGGPEAGPGEGYRGRRLGTRPYAEMPALVAAGDVGVAPYDPARLRQLALGFYWSPLKIFEYMAVGLPVVAPALPRLKRLVEHRTEGMLYDSRDPRALDRALVPLADTDVRRRMGAAARARVVKDFSWRAHCAMLDRRLRALARGR